MYCNYYKFGKCVIKVITLYNNVFDDNIHKFKFNKTSSPDIIIKHVTNWIRNPLKKYNTILNNNDWLIKESNNDIFYYYKPYNVKAISNNIYTYWKILIPKQMKPYYNKGIMSQLCLFHSDNIMMYPYLLKNNGMIVHGNGLYKNGKGILLLGESGAGKSTLTKMLEKDGWMLLCDDRTVIYNNKMYGHWVHGSYNKVNNLNCRIDKIYILKKNKISFIKNYKNYKNIFNDFRVDFFNLSKSYTSNVLDMLDCEVKSLYFNLSGDILKEIKNDIL